MHLWKGHNDCEPAWVCPMMVAPLPTGHQHREPANPQALSATDALVYVERKETLYRAARMARTDIYCQWEICSVEIPERTRLFSLKPAGIGTPEVESLSGYIARLAQAHVVSVGNLLGRGLRGRDRRTSSVAGPILTETTRSGGHGFHALGNAINGFDLRARKWTRKIGAATGRSDIEQLTLIPFARVLSAMLLFKSHRAWCPFCYLEDRKSGVVYEHLAWAIKLVTVCPRHSTRLRDACRCNQRQPTLAVFSRAGYCSHCGQWLAADVAERHGDYRDRFAKPSEYEI
jgi:hypothetical protein